MTILSQSSDFDEDPAGWGWRARRAYEEFDARRRDGSLAPIVSWRAIRAAETSGAVLAAVVAEAGMRDWHRRFTAGMAFELAQRLLEIRDNLMAAPPSDVGAVIDTDGTPNPWEVKMTTGGRS